MLCGFFLWSAARIISRTAADIEAAESKSYAIEQHVERSSFEVESTSAMWSAIGVYG